MQVKLAFGKTYQETAVAQEHLVATLTPNVLEDAGPRGQDAVRAALTHPIGTPRVGEIVRPGESVAIVTSDITRPFPAWQVLPPLLEELEAAGVSMGDVSIVFALGSHRRHTEAEMRKLVGDPVFERVRCMDHDPADTVRMGVSSGARPTMYTAVAEAHLPLLSNTTLRAIRAEPIPSCRVCTGHHTGQPFDDGAAGGVCGQAGRQSRPRGYRRGAELLSVDFIVNVVLDEHKEVLYAVCGDAVRAHQGCAFLDRLYKIGIPQRADIVLVSQGLSQDINLYQAKGPG